MKFAACVFGCIAALAFAAAAWSQQPLPTGSAHKYALWWWSMEAGAGRLKLSANGYSGRNEADFAMGIAGGIQPIDQLRIGGHFNGWLQQTYDYWSGMKGEAVSNNAAIMDVFPSRRRRFFGRGGIGSSVYTNWRPLGINGHGLGWEAGGGYEFPVRGQVRLAPMIEYSTGGLGNGSTDIYPPQTGLKYSVIEFKLAVFGNFGGRRR